MLRKLEVQNVRILKNETLETREKVVIIKGNNGSGKTSLLEAICLATVGKSFKESKTERVITLNTDEARVVAAIEKERTKVVKVVKSKVTTVSTINGEIVKNRELAKLQPLLVLSPETHRVLEDGPEKRRNIVDWGLFHVEHRYGDLLENYRRCLKQRNELLSTKGSRIKELSIWDEKLSEYGNSLTDLRAGYLNALNKTVKDLCSAFDLQFIDRLSLKRGWRENSDLLDVFRQRLEQDKSFGFTTVGPHRFDWEPLSADGKSLKGMLSRGQQKLFLYILKISQTLLYEQFKSKDIVILIDDMAAELDEQNGKRIFELILENSKQVFITTCERTLPTYLQNPDYDVFHVEHGHVIH